METYRGFIIDKNDIAAAVLPKRHYDRVRFEFTHKNYDGEGDRRHGFGPTVMDCKQQIDDLIEEGRA